MPDIILFDANVLIALFSKKEGDEIKVRIQSLINKVRDNRAKGRVLIPTPALAEFCVGASLDEIDFFQKSTFQIVPFCRRSAIECGELIKKALRKKERSRADIKKSKIKFDLQILAIAKVNNVSLLVTNDNDVAKIARENGIVAQKISDLPLPDEERQQLLDLKLPPSE